MLFAAVLREHGPGWTLQFFFNCPCHGFLQRRMAHSAREAILLNALFLMLMHVMLRKNCHPCDDHPRHFFSQR